MAYLQLTTTKNFYNVPLISVNSYRTISGITPLANSSQTKKINIPGANKNITNVSITYRFYYKSVTDSSKRRVGIELIYKDGASEVLYKDDEYFNNYKMGQFLVINYDLSITKSLKELNIIIDTDENTLIDIYNYKVLCGSNIFIERRSLDPFFVFSKNNNTYMQIAHSKKEEVPIKFNNYYLSSKKQDVKITISCAYAYDNIWVSALGISVSRVLDSGNKIIIEVDSKEYDNVFLVNYDSFIRSYNVSIYIVSNECKELIFSKVLDTMYLKTFIINEVAKTTWVNFTMIAAITRSYSDYICNFGINHNFKKGFKVDGQATFWDIVRDEYNNIIRYNSLRSICDSYGNIIPSRAHKCYTANFTFNTNNAYGISTVGDFNYTYGSGSIRIQFYTNKGSTVITRSAFNNINSANIGGNVYVDEFTANIPYYEYVLE